MGRGYLVIDKFLPWCVPGFSVRSNQLILPSYTLLPKFDPFCLQKGKMATAIMPNSRLHNGSLQTSVTDIQVGEMVGASVHVDGRNATQVIFLFSVVFCPATLRAHVITMHCICIRHSPPSRSRVKLLTC